MQVPEVGLAWDRPRREGVGWRHGATWTLACGGLVFAVALMSVAQDGTPASTGTKAVAQAAPLANQASPAAAASDGKKQISADSAQLLAMAVALKAEVDKTNKDVLSINVIRKADEIERLAHTVKEKMRKSGPG